VTSTLHDTTRPRRSNPTDFVRFHPPEETSDE
jgi:hypothetical protein